MKTLHDKDYYEGVRSEQLFHDKYGVPRMTRIVCYDILERQNLEVAGHGALVYGWDREAQKMREALFVDHDIGGPFPNQVICCEQIKDAEMNDLINLVEQNKNKPQALEHFLFALCIKPTKEEKAIGAENLEVLNHDSPGLCKDPTVIFANSHFSTDGTIEVKIDSRMVENIKYVRHMD